MVKLYLYAFIGAVILGVILVPLTIPILRRLKFGQMIREEGPQSHLKKSGTPTMGGIVFVVILLISMLFWGEMDGTLLLALVITILYGLLGFADDFIKTVKRRSLGLKAYQKLLGEVVIAVLLIFGAVVGLGRGTGLALPFYDGFWPGGVVYLILAFILVAGVTNGVNLTDGLDGLAAGTSFFAYLGYSFIAISCVANPPFPDVNYINLTIFAAVMSGICLSFLVFNVHPAKVFMGDTGSLLLGGGLAVLAILTGAELLLVIFGGVFVIEALSVMIQVTSFKLRGKRVFLMTPIHHHFEQKGWRETRVVWVFWLMGFVFMVLGLLIYYN